MTNNNFFYFTLIIRSAISHSVGVFFATTTNKMRPINATVKVNKMYSNPQVQLVMGGFSVMDLVNQISLTENGIKERAPIQMLLAERNQ